MSLNNFLKINPGIYRAIVKINNSSMNCPKEKKTPIPVVSRPLTLNKESYIDRVPIDGLAYGTYPTQFLSLQ